MILGEFSQFFVTHHQQAVAGPSATRAGARAIITYLRKTRDRRLKGGYPLSAKQQNVDEYEITEAHYALTGKTAHAAKAG